MTVLDPARCSVPITGARISVSGVAAGARLIVDVSTDVNGYERIMPIDSNGAITFEFPAGSTVRSVMLQAVSDDWVSGDRRPFGARARRRSRRSV